MRELIIPFSAISEASHHGARFGLSAVLGDLDRHVQDAVIEAQAGNSGAAADFLQDAGASLLVAWAELKDLTENHVVGA